MENIISNFESSNRPHINPTRIKVVGVGGGGGNAVNRMMQAKLAGVEFWLMNTDLQVLTCSDVPNKLQLGLETTNGLGSGGDPSVGEQAALEVKEKITKALDNTDMLFITAGMGGGTGTGAAPVVAQIAQDLGILTIAFVTKPFFWEGKKRMNQAEEGIEKLKKYVDAILVVPNDKLLQVVERQIGVREAFCVTDEVLYRGIQGLSDIITIPGMINIDFADVRKVVKNSGTALMGIGRAQGEGRAIKAAEMAINSQLLESSIDGAGGIIVNITGSSNMTLYEINDATNVINNVVKDDAGQHVVDHVDGHHPAVSLGVTEGVVDGFLTGVVHPYDGSPGEDRDGNGGELAADGAVGVGEGYSGQGAAGRVTGRVGACHDDGEGCNGADDKGVDEDFAPSPEGLADRMIGLGGGVGDHSVTGACVVGVDAAGDAVLDGVADSGSRKTADSGRGAEGAPEDQGDDSRNVLEIQDQNAQSHDDVEDCHDGHGTGHDIRDPAKASPDGHQAGDADDDD